MLRRIKTSHGTALLGVCLLLAVVLINSANQGFDQLSKLSSLVSPRSQLAAVSDFDNHLVGWWKFDEGSGSTAIDSASANNGTLVGNPTRGAGKIGSALTFDRTVPQYVTVPHIASYTIGTGDFSVSAWFKIPQDDNSGFIFHLNDSNNYASGIYIYYSGVNGGHEFRGVVGTGASITTSYGGAYADNNWHQAILTRSGSTVSFYMDGTLIGTGSDSESLSEYVPFQSTDLISIGASTGGAAIFNGSIDEVRLYNTALSSNQISQLYALNTDYTFVGGGGGGTAYNLSVSDSGSGSVSSSPSGISCGSTCSASFTSGTPITLTATPSSGYVFTGWSGGGCSGTGNCSLTLSSNTSVTATFTQGVSQASGNIYIANSTQGSDSGADCADAHSVSWFNTSSNWTNTVNPNNGKIGPGVTVHLCNTISTGLIVQGSGASGYPVTILFEPNAVMTARVWPFIGSPSRSTAIYINEYSYIVINGGTNGIIESTDNGSSYPYGNFDNSASSSAVYLYAAGNIQIENLHINNMYVRTPNSADPGGASGIYVFADTDFGFGNNIIIKNNTLTQCSNCILYTFQDTGSGETGLQIYGNIISQASIGIQVGAGGPGTLNNASIHDNDITLPGNTWDGDQDVNHNNGMHLFSNAGNETINAMKVYNNNIHGDIGKSSTSDIFFEGVLPGTLIYNNIFENDTNPPASGMIALRGCAGSQIYNNTFISSVSGVGINLISNTGTETGINIYSNILYGAGFGIYDDTGTFEGPYTGGTYLKQALAMSDHNIFYFNPIDSFQIGDHSIVSWANWRALPQGYDAHSSTIDPMFVNVSGGDYHLLSNSPARGAGTNGSDIGAYQYGTSLPTCTSFTYSAWSSCSSNSQQTRTITATTPTSCTGGSPVLTQSCTFSPPITYTLTYTANIHGSLTGTLTQTVNSGANGSAVTAVPATGYAFTSWSDNSTANPRTDTNVLGNITVSASFSPISQSVVSISSGPTTSNIDTSNATISWTTNLGASSRVLYGPTTAYGSQTTLDSSLLTSHSQSISGLLANTLYHYKVVSVDSNSHVASSSNTLTTAAVVTNPGGGSPGGGGTPGGGGGTPSGPTISNISTTPVGATSMNITWSTSLPATSQILYGLTSVYGSQTVASSSLVTLHSFTLTNLQPNTVYHFKLLSTSSGVNAPTSDLTFTTGKASTPVLPTIATPTVTPSPTYTPITEFLTLGSSDAQVLTLQKILVSLGYLKATPTGYYGSLTQSAVISFQSAHNIPTVGTVGPLTRATINSLAGKSVTTYTTPTIKSSIPNSQSTAPPVGVFTRSLKLGSTGSDVKALQVFLNSHGFIIASTGNGSKGHETTYYGPATAAAVSRFQLAHFSTILAPYGLTQGTGTFGPATMKVVNVTK